MAIIQIPNLPAVIGLDGSELFEGVQAGTSVKISLAQMIAATRAGLPTTLPLPVSVGGTGLDTFTIGDIMYASATQTFSTLADVALGNAIISGGVGAAPSYGKIGLTTHVSGVLPVANGGTGVTSSTGTGSVVLSNSPSFTGQASFADGTAALPSITNTGDLNAGLFFPAADTVAVSTAGTERMRIDASGNISAGSGSTTISVDIGGNINIPAATTESRSIELGTGRTGNGNTFIDFVGDATYTGYALRIIRSNTGADTNSQIIHRGLGALTLTAQDAGTVLFQTSSLTRLVLGALGQIGIGGATYGTTGQTIVSAGAAAAPAWGTLPVAGGGTGVTSSTGTVSVVLSDSPALTGQVSFADGTAALPSITNTGDLNTGLFFPAADTVAVSTAGVEAMRVDSNSNVGIGTTPSSILDIYKATTAILNLRGDAVTNIVIGRNSTDTGGPALALRKARGTTASQTAVASGDVMGSLTFSAYGGTNNNNIASIIGNVETYTSDTDISSSLTFKTTPTGTVTSQERMRIDDSGNVGIGENSPITPLHVAGASITTGVSYQASSQPTSKAAAATLTIAELLGGMIQYTGAAATLTLPTGTLIEGGLPATFPSGMSFDVSFINTGAALLTIGNAASGLSLTGTMTVAAGVSGILRFRKSTANNYNAYRVA